MKKLNLNGEELNEQDCIRRSAALSLSDEEKSILKFAASYLNEDETLEARTSGTTGPPKTIALRKDFMRNSAIMTGEFFGLQPGMKALLCLPVHYIAGKMMVVRAIELELQLISVAPSSQPLESITGEFDFAAMVPLQVENSIAEPESRAKFERIKQVIIGGGAISQKLQQRLQSLSNHCYATYGMTETITHVAVRKLNGADRTADFKALPGVKIWQDERNCLTVTAPHLNPDKVVTNDVVELTDFDRFRWLGRADNVINSGGVKIHPEQVEAQLDSLLDRAFFVAGLPDEQLGFKVVLVLEGEPLDQRTEALLMDTLKGEVDRFSVPKEIRYINEFRRTTSGKVKRKETLEL